MTWHIGRGDQGGQASARSVFVMTGGLALVTAACIGGGVIISGGGGSTTTTTAPATTTSTTVPSGDPCAAQNPTAAGFPCTVNAGVHGVTFTAANTTNHDSSTCTVCPPGMTWDASNGYRITSCVSIDKWKITGDVDVVISNGHKQVYGTEAAAIAGACVKLTHVLIQPLGPGKRDDVGLSTGFSNFNLAAGCAGSACGPVYMADSEIAMTNPAAAGTCSGGNACNTGFSYPASDTNLHFWRDYIHGTTQGIDSDGYSEVHDSLLRADRSDQATINAGSAQGFSGHGDAYFQDSGSPPWMLVDHNSLFCGAQMLDCNVDGAYIGDQSAPDGGTVQSNLFKASTGVNFCMAAGVSESGKPFPNGRNINIKNNVFELGAGGTPCTHGNAVKTFAPGGVNNTFCNNTMSDGTLVNAQYETGNCP